MMTPIPLDDDHRRKIYPGVAIPAGEYWTSSHIALRLNMGKPAVHQLHNRARNGNESAKWPPFPQPAAKVGNRQLLWLVSDVEAWVNECDRMSEARAAAAREKARQERDAAIAELDEVQP